MNTHINNNKKIPTTSHGKKARFEFYFNFKKDLFFKFF
jgi:hypothetical protein